jgi:hypothetical protein
MNRRYHYQHKFSMMVALLLQEAGRMGYYVIIGEVQRTKEQAEKNESTGSGIKNSLHTLSMAIDLALRDSEGVYLTDTEDYTSLGEYWESLGGNWGGRFGDGNHFSLSYPREGFKGVR